MRFDIDPVDGITVQKLVEELYATPKPLVERAKWALTANSGKPGFSSGMNVLEQPVGSEFRGHSPRPLLSRKPAIRLRRPVEPGVNDERRNSNCTTQRSNAMGEQDLRNAQKIATIRSKLTVHLRNSAKPTCVRTAGLRPDDEDPEFMAEAVTANSIDPMSGVEVQRIVDALI